MLVLHCQDAGCTALFPVALLDAKGHYIALGTGHTLRFKRHILLSIARPGVNPECIALVGADPRRGLAYTVLSAGLCEGIYDLATGLGSRYGGCLDRREGWDQD